MQFVKLHRAGQCAVRILCHLARRGDAAQFDELLREVAASRALLAGTLRTLADAEIIERVSGRPPHWRLRLPADVICLAYVVGAVEGMECTIQCPRGRPSREHGRQCAMCHAFLEAELSAVETLGRFTVADLLREPPAEPRFLH